MGLLLLFVCLAAGQAYAEVQLQSVFLSFGRSRALAANTWGTLAYVLRNPDDNEATLRLRLVPVEGATAIFEEEITIPGHRFVNGRGMVTVAPSQSYRLDVFRGERKVNSELVIVRYSDPAVRCQAFFLDDSLEFDGVSELGKSTELLMRVAQTKVPAAQAPTHWAGYDDSRIVAIGIPDYAHLGSDRCAALVEYVHRGGTLVFLRPEGVLAAAETPLADLLPVSPLRVRLIEDLPELDAWAEHEIGCTRERVRFGSPDGIPFLESFPKGDGVTTLAHDGYPVVRWRSVGLGRVGVVAVNACDILARNSGCFMAVWNHIISWSQSPYSLSYRENNTHVPKLMAQLTGYRIPGVRPVGLLLFGYAGVMTVLLLAGYALRRHAAAWTTAACLGLLATGLIFVAAYRASADRPRRGVAVLSFATTSGARAAGQAILSLQSRSDVRPTLVGQDADTLFRNLPSVTRDKRKQSGDAPLLVRRSAERSSTPAIDVAALKPRSLAIAYTPPALPVDPAQLSVGDAGLTLTPSAIPDWLPPTQLQAFLLLPNTARRVRVGDGQLLGLGGERSALQLDPFVNSLAEWFGTHRFPTPAVAFVHPYRADADALPVDLLDFVPQGYAIEFVPLRVSAPSGSVEIPPSCIRVVPGNGATRTYLANRELSIVRQPECYLEFDAILPPWLAGLQPGPLELTLRGNNPGGNLVSEVRLALPLQQVKHSLRTNLLVMAAASWQQAIAPTASRGDTYTFEDYPPTLFSPTTGRCRIMVRLAQKQFVRGAAAVERLNSWRYESILVRLTGQLSEQREL